MGTVSPPAVAVFCSSSDNIPKVYLDAARDLGEALALQGMTLVYGGGNNGLMGMLSATIAERGGRIVGVIPERLRGRGYAFKGADEMIVTDGMRERKAVMEERADAFIGLPGGFGTLEEMLEILTLRQLGFHDKPIVFLNIDGFYDDLFHLFERGFSERFMDKNNRELFTTASTAAEALGIIAVHYGV